MLARWLPDHYLKLLGLMPGQFPARPSEGDSLWQKLWRTIVHASVGDPVLAVESDPLRITLAGDQVARFPVGFAAEWGGSSSVPRARDGAADGSYVVASVSLSGGDTVVELDGELAEDLDLADLGYLRGNDTVALATGLQQVEELFFDLRSRLTLRYATGRALEVFGEILGLPRTSTDDEIYRSDLRVQAAINHSHGRIEEIIAAAAGMVGVTSVVLLEHPLARIFLYLGGALPSTGTRARIRQAKPGGVAMDIISSGSENPFVFGYDMDAAGVGADPPGEDPDGSGFGEAYPITAVLIGGPGAGAFYTANDATGALVAGDPISVQGSTNNDGDYTISAVTYEPGPVRTRIDVAEAVAAVADGSLLDGGSGSGEYSDVF